MKKSVKILSLMLALTVSFAALFSLSPSAASAGLSLSRSSVNVGDSFTATYTLNAGVPSYYFYGNVNYDTSVLTLTSGADTSTPGDARFVVDSLNGQKTMSITFNFTAKAAGTATVSVTGNASDGDANIMQIASAGLKVTTATQSTSQGSSETAKPSSDASLLEIKVSGAELVPTFNSSVTNYTANVKYNVDKVTLSATTARGATASGTGTFELQTGNNNHTITVTAADRKTKKSYNVNIRRMTEQETRIFEQNERNSNPLSVTLGTKNLLITPDITPLGTYNSFVIEKTKRGETEVTYLKDTNGRFNLYYMTDEEGNGRYYNQKSTGDFEEINYLVSGVRLYIASEIPDNIDLGSTYQKALLKTGNISIPALSFKQKAAEDIYIIYCYYNGEMGYYRYDALEKTVSRAPEFAGMNYLSKENKNTDNTLLARFNRLNRSGKTVVLLIGAAAAVILAIIVLLIIKILKGKSEKGEDAEDSILLSDIELINEDTKEKAVKTANEPDDF